MFTADLPISMRLGYLAIAAMFIPGAFLGFLLLKLFGAALIDSVKQWRSDLAGGVVTSFVTSIFVITALGAIYFGFAIGGGALLTVFR